MKLSARITESLRVVVNLAPMAVPMRVMEFSEPKVKKPRPTTSMTAPMQ